MALVVVCLRKLIVRMLGRDKTFSRVPLGEGKLKANLGEGGFEGRRKEDIYNSFICDGMA